MKAIAKLILPVAAFMLASAGAVGTKAVEDSKEGTLNITGYVHQTSNPCFEVSVNCQTMNNGQICKALTPEQNVYRLTGTNQCAELLWKVIP
ncbi:hypothetical protein GCM10007424_00460 [Flavobacterium suaedae]|uniref:Uncharacterized protein n=1 Tax=Flavobacterium suaedae TaxID=1767027 RepID=A0ABQ1JB99_9FLAO|nr:DUF6520 family protein [Flavobacterium suaedae]GGB64482.1 hypothetical protein GCM10007424_00460 [Flavobacterium suaedae]